MKTNRIKLIEKIAKQAELEKTAQDAINSVEQSQDGEEFAHKIFDILLDNLKIEGLDK